MNSKPENQKKEDTESVRVNAFVILAKKIFFGITIIMIAGVLASIITNDWNIMRLTVGISSFYFLFMLLKNWEQV